MTEKYYQISSEDVELPKVSIPDDLVYDREWISDKLYGPIERSRWIRYWMRGRYYLLFITTILPFLLFPISTLKKAYVTSLLGLLACCLPSGM